MNAESNTEARQALATRLKDQRRCLRCQCRSCDREGMGEMHDHVCTDGPDCIETKGKLRNRVKALRHLCGEAGDALAGALCTTRRDPMDLYAEAMKNEPVRAIPQPDDDVRAALEAHQALAGEEWMPIKTAPKDGSWIMAYRPPCETGRCQTMVVCRWFSWPEGDPQPSWYFPSDSAHDFLNPSGIEEAEDAMFGGDADYYCSHEFTHWRRLPQAPCDDAAWSRRATAHPEEGIEGDESVPEDVRALATEFAMHTGNGSLQNDRNAIERAILAYRASRPGEGAMREAFEIAQGALLCIGSMAGEWQDYARRVADDTAEIALASVSVLVEPVAQPDADVRAALMEAADALVAQVAGWKMVPITATDAMMHAMSRLDGYDHDRDMPTLQQWGDYWDAAIAEAPPARTKIPKAQDHLSNWPRGARARIDHDGFVGTVIGHYTTLEGKQGVVLQMDGARVVHVYGERWLLPAEPVTGVFDSLANQTAGGS